MNDFDRIKLQLATAERDAYAERWRSCHRLLCKIGRHVGCGGTVEVVDSGVGAHRCDKCGVQDWSEDAGPFDEDLLDKVETEKTLREERDRLKAALREACEIADSYNVPGHNDYDVHDAARVAELLALAGEP